MKEDDQLVRIYTGSELTVNLLKVELEKTGISSIVQNDFNSGISAGFSGGLPSSIDLFIREIDLKKAGPIVRTFAKINKE